MGGPKYEDIDAEPGYLESPNKPGVEVILPQEGLVSKGRLLLRLAIPFGLACLLFTIIVLPVYFDNLFLRITVLIVLIIGLVLCLVGILQSKQCRKNRRDCDLTQLGNGHLSQTAPPQKY